METDVIRWARASGLITAYGGRETASDELLERFAAIVRADEREQCAKVCENAPGIHEWNCAVAIRARSHVQQKPQSKD